MLREEAVQYLHKLYMMSDITDEYGDMDDTEPYETAIDMAVEALKFRGAYEIAVKAANKAFENRWTRWVEWIPCSERLPVDDDYRESMECLDGCVWYFTDKGSMGLGYYYYSTKEWSTLRDLKPDGKVIAWMPLPEPYKGDEE